MSYQLSIVVASHDLTDAKRRLLFRLNRQAYVPTDLIREEARKFSVPRSVFWDALLELIRDKVVRFNSDKKIELIRLP